MVVHPVDDTNYPHHLAERKEMNPMIRYPLMQCDYCGKKVQIWFAAYGKHSCENTACRQRHELNHLDHLIDVKPPPKEVKEYQMPFRGW